jgi:hypothetical protein
MHAGAARTRPPASPPALVGAAVVTVVAAIGLDIAAGRGLRHVVLLGLVALVVAVVRVRLMGRHRGLVGVLSGAIVLQPAFAVVAQLSRASARDEAVGPVPGLDRMEAGLLTLAVHLVLTVLIAWAVGNSDRLFGLLGRWIRRLVRAVSPVGEAGACAISRRPRPVVVHAVGCWAGGVAERGPPRTATV